jgi:TPR repeat protein
MSIYAAPIVVNDLSEQWYQQGIKYGQNKQGIKAVNALSKAVNLNHVEANYALAWLYYHGKYVTQDYNKATQLYLFAAQNGSAEAQNMMGILYSKGQGVEMNRTTAFEWLKKSAKNGHTHNKNILINLTPNKTMLDK